MTNSFFSARILDASVAPEVSAQIVEALKKEDLVDEKDGMLKKDPRHSNWRSVVATLVEKSTDSLVADKSPIAELMNVAWAMHEFVADDAAAMMDLGVAFLKRSV